MKARMLLILCISITVLGANSVFSFDGMAEQNTGADVYGKGMGETGSADLFRINQSTSNPSLMVSANKVFFASGISMGNMWYEDKAGETYRDDGLYFPYFSMIVPMGNHKIGFHFSTYLSGDLTNEMDFTWGFEGDTLSYVQKNNIRQNVFKVELLYAYKWSFVNLGIGGHYYLGNERRRWEAMFDESGYDDVKYEMEEDFKNAGFTLGLSKKLEHFSLGATYTSASELKGESIYWFNHFPGGDTLDVENEVLFETPQMVNIGITGRFSERYKISLDAHYEMWESTDTYEDNTLKVGVGFAYDPLSGYGNWYERIPLRVGAYTRNLPFRRNNESIRENAATMGFSIPLKSTNKKIEFAAKYFTRGDLDTHGLEESGLEFTFGFSGFDIFKKRVKNIKHRDIPKADL
ncbi:MAG: hypothetical protein J7K89_05370 [Candidatus Cloacimonetes bacterium]|nr:hypothetical protein [Candidatus Cloacimonadota bacterium]